jgi:hypothetical protein
MLSVIVLSVIMFSVIMLSVFMLSVIILSVIMLGVIMLSVVAPQKLCLLIVTRHRIILLATELPKVQPLLLSQLEN